MISTLKDTQKKNKINPLSINSHRSLDIDNKLIIHPKELTIFFNEDVIDN